MDKQRTIVVALGGNALQKQGEASSEAQRRVAAETIRQLLPLVQAGHRIAIVHGNGPQVGNIVLHEEAVNTDDVPSLPLDDCGAMSQGLIGFWLQQAFQDSFRAHQMTDKHAVSLVTQTIVSGDDAAFQNPTKPIGPFYSEEEAKVVQAERGYVVKEDAGRGWRRVVPSPKPVEIVEAPIIKALVEAGVLVVSTGGGGIPVLRQEDGTLTGVEAVIDKDFGAATLANCSWIHAAKSASSLAICVRWRGSYRSHYLIGKNHRGYRRDSGHADCFIAKTLLLSNFHDINNRYVAVS